MSSLKYKIRPLHLVAAGHLSALCLMLWTCDAVSRKDQVQLSGVVHYSGREFAGSETCAGCHSEISTAHLKTAHYRTSYPASVESIQGNFDSGSNVFVLKPGLEVVMEKDSGKLYQRAMINGRAVARKPVDLVIGSGRHGQTYLYWDGEALSQLPASWYSPTQTWCNSPGYPADQILFNRYVPARCLECHSTYASIGKTVAGRETFRKDQFITGVDCERCHGPAADHVRYHFDHPNEIKGQHIINPASLTRQQRLDNCGLCHSGIRENFLPSFTFVTGENLDDFFFPAETSGSGDPDVHGNQYGLLAASKCFKESDMDCSSCHNVHSRESGQRQMFSARCMNCHAQGGEHFCKQPALPGLTLTGNCIDCHMPALPSRQVFMQSPDSAQPTPFLIRTHRIAVYDEEIERFLARISDSR